MHSIALDRLDVRILELLMKDSRIPRLELAKLLTSRHRNVFVA